MTASQQAGHNNRKARTRTLIQRHCLLEQTNLPDQMNIEVRQDLQLEPESWEQATLLLGHLLDHPEGVNDTTRHPYWRQRGNALLGKKE